MKIEKKYIDYFFGLMFGIWAYMAWNNEYESLVIAILFFYIFVADLSKRN